MKNETQWLNLPAGVFAGAVLLTVAGCQGMHDSPAVTVAPVDGDIAVPAGYRDWTKFVPTVDKAEAGQVREIYINSTGLDASAGEPFPNGTISVMEIYAAQKDAAGSPVVDGNGRLVKDKLSKVFIMEKGQGWGAAQAEGVIDNGDWVYGAYEADGTTPATGDFNACRACHQPLASDDFVARYQEHFDQRD